MELRVSKNAIVYGLVELSNGKQYVYLAPSGKTDRGALIDILASYTMKGPAIVHAFDIETGKELGISTQSVTTIEEVSFSEADDKWLAKSHITLVDRDEAEKADEEEAAAKSDDNKG